MDRVYDAFYGKWGGSRIQSETRQRMEWLLAKVHGDRILDIGCSQGLFPLLLAEKRRVDIIGIDINAEAIAFANTALEQRKPELAGSVSFACSDFESYPIPTDQSNLFDAVVIGQVMEHLSDPKGFVGRAAKFLRPGGQIIVTVPYGLWEHDEHEQTFYARDIARLFSDILPLAELELVGGRLAAVLIEGRSESLSARELEDREYEFFVAKERRHVEAYNQQTAVVATLSRRLASQWPVEIMKRGIKRMPFSVTDTVHPAKLRELAAKTGSSRQAVKKALLRVEKSLGTQKTFGGQIRLRTLPAMFGYKRPLERVKARQRLLDNGFALSERKTAPDFSPEISRILYAAHFSLPDRARGYGTRTQELIRGLRHEGWDVEGVTRLGFPHDLDDVQVTRSVPASETVDGVLYHRLGSPAQNFRTLELDRFLTTYAEALTKLILERRPVLIHAASNHVNGIAAAEAAARSGLPFVYEVRGLWELTQASREPGYFDSAEHRLAVKLERQTMMAADRVLCLNQALRDCIIDEYGIPAEKIALAPNAADPDRFKSAELSEVANETQTTAIKEVTVAYIGSVLDYEGVDDLVRAAAILKGRNATGINWLVVGDGPDLKHCKDLAQKLGVANEISFVGVVPFDEVARRYAQADILVCPRKPMQVCEVVTPVKIFEAISMGKPVIVSDVAALKEVAEDSGACLTFTKGSVEALADRILELSKDPVRRLEMGRKGRQFIETERSWQAIARGVGEVYKSLGASAHATSNT